jgi:hypothetical protein
MVSLTAVERAYFIRKLGGNQSPQKSTSQIKREYISAYIGGATPQTSMEELEYQWQLKVLADAGVAENDLDKVSDLWKEMVATTGQTPSHYINDNIIKFYLNAP